jgi:hypothetical protein
MVLRVSSRTASAWPGPRLCSPVVLPLQGVDQLRRIELEGGAARAVPRDLIAVNAIVRSIVRRLLQEDDLVERAVPYLRQSLLSSSTATDRRRGA